MSRVTTLVYDDALEVGADVAALVGIERFGGLLYQRRRLWEHVAAAARKAGFTNRIHLRDGSDRLVLAEEIGVSRAGPRIVYLTADVVAADVDGFARFLAKLAYSDVDVLVTPAGVSLEGGVASLSRESLRALLAARTPTQRRTWFVDFPGPRIPSDPEVVGIASAEPLVRLLGNALYTRAFNQITRVGRTVVKRSADRVKLRREHDWWYHLPPALQRFAVQPYGYEQDVAGASYQMERLAIPDFAVLWVHGPDAVPDDVFAAFLDAVTDWFVERPTRVVPAEEATAKALALYVDKVETRVERLLATDLGRRVDALVHSGTADAGLRGLVDRYRTALTAEWARTGPGTTLAITHGDLCFSNVLFDKRTRMLRFVDPRGANTADELWDHPAYDLAKLSHSVLGGYDFVNSELFDVGIGPDLALVLRLDRGPVGIREEMFVDRVKALGFDPVTLRLYEASLFLSMLPLHAEAPRKVVAYVLQAGAALDAVAVDRARTPSRLARWLGAS